MEMNKRERAEIVKLKPNVKKILASVAYLISRRPDSDSLLTQYQIVKAIFLADKTHLNKWGRPITYDNYVAMEFGPVPSLTYDFLKNKNQIKQRHEIKNFPWESRPKKQEKKTIEYFNGQLDIVKDILSKSDIDILDMSLSVISELAFPQIRCLTHQDPAYIEAWKDGGEKKAYPMSLGMLLEIQDFSLAKEIEGASKFV